MNNVATDILVKDGILEILPFNAAIIDSHYRIIRANKGFENDFGAWDGKRCYEACRREKAPCSHCRVQNVLREGKNYSTKDSLLNKNCGLTQYSIRFSPLTTPEGDYVMIIYFNENEEALWQREYNLLFEKVPSMISVIDREFNIVRINDRFRSCFGDMRGKKCFEAYKRKGTECLGCPAVETFNDGLEHTGALALNNLRGEKSQFVVTTVPLAYDDEGVSLIMEIGTDITEIMKLQEQLRNSHDFCTTLLNNSSDAIIALDKKGKVLIFNDSIQELLDWKQPRRPGINQIAEIMPKEFFDDPDEDGSIARDLKALLTAPSGENIPVTLSAYELRYKKQTMGRVAFITDERPKIDFEKRKIENERQSRARIFGSLNEKISGMLHVIDEDVSSLGKAIDGEERDCEKIMTSYRQLKNNFENTLDIVGIYMKYAEDPRPRFQLIDAETLIYGMINRLEEWLRSKNIHIISEIRLPIEPSYFNIEAFEDFFKILVTNACTVAPWNSKNPVSLKLRVVQKGDEILMDIYELPYEMEASKEIELDSFRRDIQFGLATAELIAGDHGAILERSSDKDWSKLFRLRISRKKSEEFARYFNEMRVREAAQG